MRLLLDTHIFLWIYSDSMKLSPEARRQLSQAESLYVSSASIWEISIKAAWGKVDIDLPKLMGQARQDDIWELPVKWEHAAAVKKLENHHRDTFDRILMAQAQTEPFMKLLTQDEIFRVYKSK